MTNVVKIKKGKQTAEVVDRYVGDFLRDGWAKVDEYIDEVGAQSTKEAEKLAQEKSLRDAELELKHAQEEKDRQEEGEARVRREIEDAERKRQQDALNHSRGNIDHARNILDLEDKDAVKEYVKSQFNKDVDLRGSLEVVKEKALLISKEVH